MKTIGKVILWIFAVIGVLMLLLVFILANSLPSKPKVKIHDNTYLELSLGGLHYDYNEYENIFFIREAMSIGDMCRKIDAAMQDSRIKGIIIKPGMYMGGWALTKELHDKLIEFKESGKDLFAYIDFTYDKGYYLASTANEIYFNPSSTAGIVLSGIGIELSYYEGLLEKIGIDVTVLHSGKYKGTGEMFDRKTMSPELKEDLTRIIDGLYDTYISDLQTARGLSNETVSAVFEERDEYFLSGDQAHEYGLVDHLGDEQDFEALVVKDNPIVKFSLYEPHKRKFVYDKIAVLYAQGGITIAEAGVFERNYRKITKEKTINLLNRIEKMKSVKGLVLRVDSGGGSSLVSDIILNKLEELNEKMPVVISMGSVAASGGYWISSLADYIFAQPNTITGSIGVVSMIPNWQQLREWANVNTFQIQRGKYANFFSLNYAPSEQDIAALKKDMDGVYLEFKDLVARGRNLPLTDVEEVAQGKIWTGIQALENGLIDELGGMDNAIAKAAELAEIDDYSVLVFPEKKTLMDILLNREISISAVTLLKLYGMTNRNPLTDNISQTMELIRDVQHEPVQLRLPYNLDIQ
ncbi:MAG: signal peptide peptidase SppA [Candidatus Cloacimonas sp. 4484_140]|nr:MAG: signal peptide peptidase SppA [Candidatus Cloacimonas sp. 4484_140]